MKDVHIMNRELRTASWLPGNIIEIFFLPLVFTTK